MAPFPPRLSGQNPGPPSPPLPPHPTVWPSSNPLGSAFERGPESDAPAQAPMAGSQTQPSVPSPRGCGGPAPRSFPAPSAPHPWASKPPSHRSPRTGLGDPPSGLVCPADPRSQLPSEPLTAPSVYLPSLHWGSGPGSTHFRPGLRPAGPSAGMWLRDVTSGSEGLMSGCSAPDPSLAAVSPSAKRALTRLPQPHPGPRARGSSSHCCLV